MIARLAYVMCDKCGNPAETADDAVGARILAGRTGFKRIRGKDGRKQDLCRHCAEPDPADKP